MVNSPKLNKEDPLKMLAVEAEAALIAEEEVHAVKANGAREAELRVEAEEVAVSILDLALLTSKMATVPLVLM
jgi:hypothetical protein